MDNLLELQELDARISACRQRETEIPKQKHKFDIYREGLKAELDEREKGCTDLDLEQRGSESEIEQNRALIERYLQQLNAVKKNEEYQALLHEIDLVKKQIGIKEERILAIMLELDDLRAKHTELRTKLQNWRTRQDPDQSTRVQDWLNTYSRRVLEGIRVINQVLKSLEPYIDESTRRRIS